MTIKPDLTNVKWNKASLSESSNGCVEVGFPAGTGLVAVRDSKEPAKSAHLYPITIWSDFLDHLRGTLSAEESRIAARVTPDGVELTDKAGEALNPHTYTHHEWACFLDGVHKQEPQLIAA
ncbi:DUF397 domain-containing protein [Streptomyces sp. NPDC007088]|uniref:DUF397 domain-containing protein n=1 Tax=Streptomyces sp. NPDC007088 TaxID=3364773 RepID=UPI0036B0BFFB